MATHSTGQTSSPDVTQVLTTWLNRKFVSDLEYTLQHQKFTLKAIIPRGEGNIGRFIEFAAPTAGGASYSLAGSTALTEGTTTEHEITGIETTGTEITIAEFGEHIKTTQLYMYAAVRGTREKLAKRLRDGAAVSLDSVVHGKASGSTNTVYATSAQVGGQAAGPATVFTLGAATIIFARKVLFEGLAKGFEGISGHPRDHYAAVITPKQELDIVTEVTTDRTYWTEAVVNVPGAMAQEKWVNGYIGSIYGTAVYVTNNYVTASLTATAEIGYVYADGGVGAMAFRDMNARVIINDVNSPYKNKDSVAWWTMFNAALISSTRVVKLYSAT